jgi:nucleoside-diphosphate-sugar epimerase
LNLLVVGGSGHVGRLMLPILVEHYELRVFDRTPPVLSGVEYIEGDVTDPVALLEAAQGMDLLLFMAMGKTSEKGIFDITAAYDVNAKGVHLAMDAAAKAGVKRAVYTSSLSVHDGADLTTGAFDSEEVKPEPTNIYGHTKWMGEEACRFVNRTKKLPILALRLFLPVDQETWHARHDPNKVDCRTSAPDLGRALLAALQYEHTGFEVIHITGDTSGRAYKHEKAKAFLNWQPEEI